ncbi:translation initiation factor IF-2 [Candidatus Woesearchaeota archaeon]|nr:translation initiation factor IF-2 [Candidatus Woesearchaeota archaeon]
MLRQVIVTIMGNVDAGKSQTIDIIKKTSIVESEPGRITQSIRAYAVPIEVIKEICRPLSDLSKIQIPGLLFLDTPGHKAFSNLRKRGGALADLAILVIDIKEGIKPQTIESIEILKQAKTPFVIALNKIDLLNGWQQKKSPILIKDMEAQNERTRADFEKKMYDLVAQLYELGFQADRFDRIDDYTKKIAMVPIAAKTGEGIPELLMIVTGLAQKFLETSLQYNEKTPAKGTILEVMDEKGLGTTLDTIIYDGKISVGDQIVIGSLHEALVSKVKALFIVEKNQLKSIKNAEAAIGVKIVAQNTKEVIPGMPVRVANKEVARARVEVQKEVEDITLELEKEGVIIKADALGSLEALITILKEKQIPIKRASIGAITKKDIAEAAAEAKQFYRTIVGFRVKQAEAENIKIFTNDVIYTLVEKFEEWYIVERQKAEAAEMGKIVWPAKFYILPGYIFRQSNPAIVGIEVLGGKLKALTPIRKDNFIGELKGIQHEGKSVEEAKKGQSVAVSISNVTIGRQLKEGDILYTDISENDFKKWKKWKKLLNEEEIKIIKEIAEMRRKENPMWGM